MSNYNKITTYYDFTQYCLRKLGAPVINIEVTDEQIIDRISDALQFYLDTDLESVQNQYWIHKVTAEDEQNQYLLIPPDIIDVMELRTKDNAITSGTVGFDGYDSPEFQYWDFYWKNNYGAQIFDTSVMYFEMTMQHISLIKNVFNVMTEFLHRPIENKVYLYNTIYEGQIIVMYGTKRIDIDNNDNVWDSVFLKQYATALIGVQWGTNISKYGNVPSVAGLTLNGDQLLERYTNMKNDLEEKQKLERREPPLFFLG